MQVSISNNRGYARPSGSASREYAGTIDLIRFLFCSILAIGHIAPAALIGKKLSLFLVSGIVSAVFFALSGFILCQTSSFWHETWGTLAMHRFARIYPVHMLGFVTLLPFLYFGLDGHSLAAIWAESIWWLTGLQSFRWGMAGALVTELNGPAWSVTPLLFGGMLLPLIRFLGLQSWRASRLFITVAALVFLRIGLLFLRPYSSDPSTLVLYHVEPVSHVIEMFAGGTAALMLQNSTRGKLVEILERDTTFLFLAAALFLPLTTAIYLAGAPGAFYVVHGPILPVSLLFLVSGYLNTGSIAAFCKAPWVKSCGEQSILIFLLHVPTLVVMQRLFLRSGFSQEFLDSALFAVLAISGTFSVSYLLLPFYKRTQMGILNSYTRRTDFL